MSLGIACSAVGMLRAVRSVVELVLMAIVIILAWGCCSARRSGCYDGDDLIVWGRLVTWGTDSLSWLTFYGTLSLVVGALFAARNVAVRVLIVVVVAGVDDVNAGAGSSSGFHLVARLRSFSALSSLSKLVGISSSFSL